MNVAPHNGRCVWCGSPDYTIFPEPISRYADRMYYCATCHRCGTRWALPFDVSGVDYDQIQRTHVGYSLIQADHAWVSTMFQRGPAAHWSQLITDYMCLKSIDTRYVHAIRRSYAAAKRKRVLRILEIGCNLGYVGAVFLRHGHTYTGLDVQADVIEHARASYGDHFYCQTLEAYAEQTDQRFDLVLAIDTIEHVPQPAAFLQTCLDLLDDHGMLMFTTPDGDQMAAGEWYTDLPPIHATVFCRRSFTTMAASTTPPLQVRFLPDMQREYAPQSLARPYSKHLRAAQRVVRRITRGLRRQSITETLPNLDPQHPQFAYRPQQQELHWSFPDRSWAREVAKQGLFFAAALVGLKPVGYTLIVELIKNQGIE
ncbi:MAG: methyltransferase domain-containing protein [Chloroflexaceae bacterium]|nr:methyltransferase domain-containing protein [Chloroflexaceae bacterium]